MPTDDFFIVETTFSHQGLSYDTYISDLKVGYVWPPADLLAKAIAKAREFFAFGGGYADPIGSLTRRLMVYTD